MSQQMKKKSAGGLTSALAADLETLSLSRRNMGASLMQDAGEAEAPAAAPAFGKNRNTAKKVPLESSGSSRNLSNAGNPLVDYATSARASRDVNEFVPRSIDEAAYMGSVDKTAAAVLSPSVGSLKANFLSEEVIRSLPKPLAPVERERVIREKEQTPTFELVRRVNKYQELIKESSEEGQKLRRQLLSGAVVVIICAGYSGKRFIYEHAKKLGVKIVIVDGPDSWAQTLVDEGVIEKFIPLDMTDAANVFAKALCIVESIDEEVGGIDGVCTFWENAIPLVARLTEKMGLPGNSAAAIDCARDKYATRMKLKEANLPTPATCMIYSEADLPKAAQTVGFPSVMKPINGAASLGVVKVESEANLKTNYDRIIAILEEQSEGVVGIGDGKVRESGIMKDIMLEQYLDGDEVDVDMILCDGKATYCKVTDNLPTYEPWFNETGACTPSILPEYKQKELGDISFKMCEALGLTTGVMHVELKYTTKNGPQLIEVNARMGGGPVRDLNLAVWGVDLVEEQLMASVGLPANPPCAEKPLKCIAEYSVNSNKTGKIGPEFDAVVAKFEAMPDVLSVEKLVSVGDAVVGVDDGMPTWIADIVVEKPTAEEAIKYACELNDKFEQPIY